MPANMAPISGGPPVKAKVTKSSPKLHLTPIQQAAENITVAKEAPVRAASRPIAGPGITPKQQAAEEISTAKHLALPSSRSYAPAKAKKSKGEDATFKLALIKALHPAALIPGTAKIGVNLGQDIENLPASTVEGVAQLGQAGVQSVEQGSANPLLHMVSAAASTDPLFNLVTGHVGRALHLAGAHPLSAGLDALGGYGVIGKAAGAVGRSGALGEDVANAASMGGRAAKVVAPDVPGSALTRGYSPNILTKGLQVAKDKLGESSPIPAKAAGVKAEHALRLQVATHHASEEGALGSETQNIVKALKKVKPKGKEEAAVAPLVAMTGTNRVGLQSIIDNLLKESTRGMQPETLAARDRTIANIQAALKKDDAGKFDWDSVNRAAAAYKPLAAAQEAQKAELGTRDVAEMQRRLDNARALLEPDVHYLKEPVPNPLRLNDLKDAAQVVRERRAELDDALKNQAANKRAHQVVGKHITSTLKRLPIKYSTSDLIPGSSADRLASHLLDEREMVRASSVTTKAEDADVVKSARLALRDAERGHREAVKSVKAPANRLRGTVIEDPDMPALNKGPLKGLRVRPLAPEDMDRIREDDPAEQSYVSARNPERQAATPARQAMRVKAGDTIAAPAERGLAPYTGEALHSGDLRAGWSLLPNTLLRGANAISDERELQNFFDRFSIQSKSGLDHYPTLADAKHAATQYESDHGIRVSTLDDNGVFRNVPTAAVRELNRQRSLDRPSALGKLLTVPNRIFRKTVLPYSPKLPVMHQVENTSRLALMERGNLPRILTDFQRGRAILKASEPEARARLQTLVTPGSLSRSGAAGEAEDLGRLDVEHSVPRTAVKAVAHTLDTIATRIIQGQRALEHAAQTAALGAHGRQLLQEWGHSWTDANTAVTQYADKLAAHLATPADAERAARSMHTALGKYNAFTANTRLALRVMPFGSWYGNAARLVMVTLPKDHPLFSALVQDTHNANEKAWDAAHKGLPSDLQTALPVGPGAYLDIGKLTPIGLPNQSPMTTLSQLVLPEFSGALAGAMGKDPFWADLYGSATPFGESASPEGLQSETGAERNQAALSAVEQLVESMAGPTNDIARAVYGHGGVLYNVSTPDVHLLTGGLVGHTAVKPGTTTQQRGILHLPPALDKVLDPFHPTTFRHAQTTPARAESGKGVTLGGSSTTQKGTGVTDKQGTR